MEGVGLENAPRLDGGVDDSVRVDRSQTALANVCTWFVGSLGVIGSLI